MSIYFVSPANLHQLLHSAIYDFNGNGQAFIGEPLEKACMKPPQVKDTMKLVLCVVLF